MTTLVSPGVSVTITNESFFFPASASTVPLFFIATRADKMQTDGITPAAGTLESGVVRTITSLAQSLETYGIPYFHNDMSGNEFHGDARNEYGLLALNQFLGVGNVAYVVRANINLDDTAQTFISYGVPGTVPGSTVYNGIGNGTLGTVTATDNTVKPQTISIVFTTATGFTVSGSVSGFIGTGTVGVAFTGAVSFTITAGVTAFSIGDYFTLSLGYVPTSYTGTGTGKITGIQAGASAVAEVFTITATSATSFTVTGSISGALAVATVGTPYTSAKIAFTINAGATAFVATDAFVITASSVTVTNALGATDANKRATIVTALQAAVVSNLDVRSELYEFNLIAAPGYWELGTDLVALATDINLEALVIADTPYNLTPDQTVAWGLTVSRTTNNNIAYYYPWCLTTNLDGRDVLGAPSGTALRTIAFSDNQSYLWEAPAGVNRGVVTGVSQVGYITGTPGTATTFIQVSLNNGQRDTLYDYDVNINPIVFFPGRGILIWGQKVSAAAASSLDRVNVVRLVAYLARTLRKGGMPFVFEPNDQITRDNLKAAADALLADVMSKRGLYDFGTLCDKSNNTAARIQANELWLDVAIKPTIAAEFIYIPIRVLATGATI